MTSNMVTIGAIIIGLILAGVAGFFTWRKFDGLAIANRIAKTLTFAMPVFAVVVLVVWYLARYIK